MKRTWIVVITLLIVTPLAGLAWWNYTLSQDVDTLRASVRAASSDAAAAREAITQLEARTGSGQQQAAQEVEKLAATVRLLKECVPELEDQLNSLEFDSSGFVFPSTNVSRHCQDILFGFNLPPGE